MTEQEQPHPLIEVACSYWFNDNDKVRTPFPKEMQQELRAVAQKEYFLWEDNLSEQDKKEVTQDEMASVFESFLFGQAVVLAGENADLLLTIHFPFMPRVGDVVTDKTGKHGPSRIITRELDQGKDKLRMKVSLEGQDSKETWETEFEIPE